VQHKQHNTALLDNSCRQLGSGLHLRNSFSFEIHFLFRSGLGCQWRIQTIPSQVECDIGMIRKEDSVASLAELAERRNQMRKTNLFAIAAAAALILIGVGGRVASTPQASFVAPTERIDTAQLTMNAKDMPTQHIHDLTFVFD
jgi:hypothetical protein